MKSTKLMLSGIMLMLLSFAAFLIDYGNNSWLAGVAVVLIPLALVVFVFGLVSNK